MSIYRINDSFCALYLIEHIFCKRALWGMCQWWSQWETLNNCIILWHAIEAICKNLLKCKVVEYVQPVDADCFPMFFIKWTSTVWRFAALCLSSACTCPHSLSWKPASLPSPEIFIFLLRLHFKLSHRCVCLFPLSISLVQRYILCLSFFLFSFFLSFFLPLCLCHTLSLPHALSFPHSFVNLLLQREQMSILSDVPCTNHPLTDTAQRRRLAQLKHVECNYPCVCSVLRRACSQIHNSNDTQPKTKPSTVHPKHQ